MLSDVARGLSYLQSEVRVIHRDIKCANVCPAARQQRRHYIHARHGKQVYMSPEHKNGELPKVEVFTFGLVVLETLTGYVVCSSALGPAQARAHRQAA